MNQEIGCLKYGLNAVVFRNSRELTAEERMKRYYAASVAYPHRQLALREQIGASLRAAWKDGKRPNLKLISRMVAALGRS